MRRLTSLALLACLVMTAAPSRGAVLPSAGVVYDGTLRGADDALCIKAFDLRFVGRMPAGPRAYTVTDGSGSIDCPVSIPRQNLVLDGETLSGSFQWVCESGFNAGPMKPFGLDPDDTARDLLEPIVQQVRDAIGPPVDEVIGQTDELRRTTGVDGFVRFGWSCRTGGFPQTFRLIMYLLLGEDLDPDDSGYRHVVKGGAYIVTP